MNDNSTRIARRQAGSDTRKTSYTSPTVEYAAHPIYGQFFNLRENHLAQNSFLVQAILYVLTVYNCELKQ